MRVSSLLPAMAAVLLIVFPFVINNPYYQHLVVLIAIYAILVLGLDIVVGYTGEVSLGHAALFGIGSYTAGVLKFQLGLGLATAIPAGIITAALFGAVLALPALRVTGPYLAMVTLAFGTIVQILINEMDFLTNGPLGISLRKPELLGVLDRNTEYYYLVLVFLGATIVAVNRIVASRFGRAFEALRDSPIACDCMGVSVYRHKVYAFVISAGLAGLAGALYTYSEQYISPNTYSFEQTILFLLAATMGGRKSRLGPILGSLIVVMLPQLLSDIALVRIMAGIIAAAALLMLGLAWRRGGAERVRPLLMPGALCVALLPAAYWLDSVTDLRLTLFGLMILFVVYYLPDGLLGWLRDRLGLAGAQDVAVVAATDWSPTPPPTAAEAVLLAVDQVVMQFGGLRALDQVDLAVAPGSVHGLIGPNGSGKSTMMNVLTGIYRPTAGRVRLLGHDLAGLPPAAIARRGIARTFQNVQLFGEMTALDNVLVGLHNTQASSLADVILGSPAERRSEAAARARALAILRFVGLESVAGIQARSLPYGKQRLLEIGRALALAPILLLLDEPAAGLTAPDIRELVEIIGRIKAAGITLILIEHHMDVVMSVSDTVTVLDFGEKIAEGKPAQIQVDPRVIEAYLGAAPADAAVA